MKKRTFLASTLVLLLVTAGWAQNRKEYLLEKNWKFIRTDEPDQKNAAFDDSKRLTAIEKDKANWLNAAEVASLTFPAGFVRVDG